MNYKKFLSAMNQFFVRSGYTRVARALLDLSDEQLKEAGLSRPLLRKGYAGYPWRVETEANDVQTDSVAKSAVVTPMPKQPATSAPVFAASHIAAA